MIQISCEFFMEDLLQKLNPEQKLAVTHEHGPLLIIAGAGTGKTMVITRRIAYLVSQKKIKTDEILALTFTDKAAGEMEERVDKLLPYGYTDLWVSTFHSFCERILKNHAIDIGLPGDFKLLNQTEQWLLVRQNLDKFNLDYYRPLGNPTKFIHALLTHFSRAKDEVIEPAEYLEYAKNIKLDKDSADLDAEQSEVRRLEEVANAFHVYQNLLLENNALDFGDLINYTLKLLKERPKILNEYRKQFKYILVDEFQDTNYAQYELMKLLAAPNNNLTVVGDDDQSVYKFRGASISNILQFKEDFKDYKEIVLTKNYRSHQNILDLSYNFIQQNNPNRLEVKLKGGLNKKLEAQVDQGGEIKHLHFKSLDDESEGVVQKIVDIKNERRNKALPYSLPCSWSDFAILVRANNSANSFVSVLNKKGVPYQFFALRGLYSKPIILDCIAYLKLLYDRHDDSAFNRVLNFPMWKLSALDISKINYEARKKTQSIFEVLESTNILGQSQILSLLEKHSSLGREKMPSEILLAILNDTGYYKYILGQDEQTQKDVLSFLDQFYKRIKKSEVDISFRVNDFLSEIEYEIEAGDEGALRFDPDVGPDMVRIMTIHAAKGLEFDYVFIPNLVDKRFPTIRRGETIKMPDDLIKEILPEGDIHLEEERRLFYVAMTRARKNLYLTSAEDYGGARKKKPSRFLTELGFECTRAPLVSNRGRPLYAQDRRERNIQGRPLQTTPLPRYFSFTQLTAFDNCPLQYKFAHILKIPVMGKAVFSYGKTMHNTLQKFVAEYLKRKNVNQESLFSNIGTEQCSVHDDRTGHCPVPTSGFNDLLKIYEENWIDEWYESKGIKEEYKKLGKESLKKFYEDFIKNNPKPLKLEEGFFLKVGDYTIKGRIDRIDEFSARGGCASGAEDGVEIIDYKTGQSKGDKISKDNKKQLLIYQLAAEECMKLKPKKLTYYYLNDGKQVSFLGSETEKENLKREIIEEIEKIKNSDFTANPKGGGRTCVFCDFKKICSFKQI